MGWEDRSYYRDRSGATGNRLLWILSGSVPFFTAFGIRVRIHASLLFLIAVTLITFWVPDFSMAYRVVTMAMLFLIVLLHEFGHCFAARRMGGSADDIMMWPLGGLAFADPPHRPWPSFVTAAGGPFVNVLICAITGSLLFWCTLHHLPPLNPFNAWPPFAMSWSNPSLYLWWMYTMSYYNLLFNVLPIYPLDGGRMLHAILWPFLGDRKALGMAALVGIPGGVLLAILGLMNHLNLLLIFIGIWVVMECRRTRIHLKELAAEEGPWASETPDFSASLFETEKPRRRKVNKRAIRRARRIAQAEAMERSRVDMILAKVSAKGMQSLTWSERRALKKATEHQRQRDLDLKP